MLCVLFRVLRCWGRPLFILNVWMKVYRSVIMVPEVKLRNLLFACEEGEGDVLPATASLVVAG